MRAGITGGLVCVCFAGVALAQPCAEWIDRSDEFMLPTSNPAVAFDSARDRIVSHSIFDGNMYTSEWNGSYWNVVDAGFPPGGRGNHAMAFDSWRGVCVLFGGGAEWQDDTWEWDGSAWSFVPARGPQARTQAGLAFDAARGVTVLHGGYDGTRLQDTWEFDGSEWVLVDEAGFGPRVAHAMAFDGARQEVVAFGGTDSQGRAQNDTWVWDGSSWRQAAADGPPPTWYHRMVYDPQRELVVLVGGIRSQGDQDDLWLWDGTAWRSVPAQGPGQMYQHGAEYHAGTDRIVVFGGHDRRTEIWEIALFGPPRILDHPRSLEAEAGASFELSVSVDSETDPTFQWHRDGQPLSDDGRISGSQSPVLTVSDVTLRDAGAYTVVADNGCGSVESDPAIVTVVCRADFNDDGIVDTLDVLLFLNAWSSRDGAADFNDDGTVNTLDFLAFLNAWGAGC